MFVFETELYNINYWPMIKMLTDIIVILASLYYMLDIYAGMKLTKIDSIIYFTAYVIGLGCLIILKLFEANIFIIILSMILILSILPCLSIEKSFISPKIFYLGFVFGFFASISYCYNILLAGLAFIVYLFITIIISVLYFNFQNTLSRLKHEKAQNNNQ